MSDDLTFDRPEGRFNLRVVGVAFRERPADGIGGRYRAGTRDDVDGATAPGGQREVLLSQFDGRDFWLLPGGRPRFGESSHDALAREMNEELDEPVTVGAPIWVVESFFTLDGRAYHELSTYCRLELTPDGPTALATQPWRVVDGGEGVTFKWFPVGALAELRLLPSFLVAGLADPPAATTHVVHVAD